MKEQSFPPKIIQVNDLYTYESDKIVKKGTGSNKDSMSGSSVTVFIKYIEVFPNSLNGLK